MVKTFYLTLNYKKAYIYHKIIKTKIIKSKLSVNLIFTKKTFLFKETFTSKVYRKDFQL